VDGETNQFQSNGLEGSSNINLRGLGQGRTLVLLNGKRIVPNPYAVGESGQQFLNINQIPSIGARSPASARTGSTWWRRSTISTRASCAPATSIRNPDRWRWVRRHPGSD